MSVDDAEQAIVVSGGTGVLGRALLDELAGENVIALIHRHELEPRPGLTQIRCDLNAPRLGLGEHGFDALRARTKAVVHSAAVTDFNADAVELRAVNLAGTRGMAALAERAGAPLHHISSAFVDRLADAQAIRGTACADGRDAYLQSKLDCEELLRDNGYPHVVLRPSLLIGDSASGAIHRRQGLHAMLGAYCSGALPFLPFDGEALIDFVPQDVLARAVAHLIVSGTGEGAYWLTSGAAAMSVRGLTSLAGEVLAEHSGRRPAEARYFSIDTLNRLILPAFQDCFDQRSQRLFENLAALASLFPAGKVFPSDFGSAALRPVRLGNTELASSVDATVQRYFLRPAQRREVAA